MLQGLFLIRSLHFEFSTYRVIDKHQMKLFQAVGEKHSARISLAFFPPVSNTITSRSACAVGRTRHLPQWPPW